MPDGVTGCSFSPVSRILTQLNDDYQEKMMKLDRRYFLKIATVAGASTLSLLHANDVMATWVISDPANPETGKALADLLQGEGAEGSDLLNLSVPEYSENPGLVPILVNCELESVRSITLLIDDLDPVAATFQFGQYPVNRISTRLRVADSTTVWAIARTRDKSYISESKVLLRPFHCAEK